MNKKLDNILIELDVFAVQDGKDVWMQGDLLIIINNLKPYSESDIINSEMFFKSIKFDGEYDIFSCSCGIPECNGWVKKIQVSTHKNVVKWVEPNLNKIWNFDKERIIEQVESLEKEVHFFKEYFKKKLIYC